MEIFFIITILGVWEFYTLSELADTKAQKIWGTITAAILFATNAYNCHVHSDFRILAINIPFIFIIFILELYRKSANPFKNIAFTILGIVYVALPFSLLNYLVVYSGTYSYELLFGFFFILWANDCFLLGYLSRVYKQFR